MEQTEETAAPVVAPEEDGELARLHDVSVELAVELGRTSMTIRETLGLAPGSIVALQRQAGEPVDLLVNGKPLARGEVVVIDEEFGLRITEIVGPGGTTAAPLPPLPDAGEPQGDEAAFAPFDDQAAPAHPFGAPPGGEPE